MRTLLIDNYDSYTYNLFQLIAEVNGVPPVVLRNDAAQWSSVELADFDNVVVSPGPGHPGRSRDFGRAADVIAAYDGPLLGVCLGHQGIGLAAGAPVVAAPTPRHGHLSRIRHLDDELFAGVPQDFVAVRYHSLCLREPLPATLFATAWAEDGVVMAVRRTDRPQWGVQFHPESVATEHGHRLLENFRDLTRPRRRSWAIVSPGPAACAKVLSSPRRFSVRSRRMDGAIDAETVFALLYGDSPQAFWLDSSLVEAGRSRFSFLGDDRGPYAETVTYRVGAGEVVVESSDGRTTHPGTIFDVLAARATAVAVDAGDLPFAIVGGHVGYFGYELKADCGGDAAHRAETPDAVWIFADRVVAVDHAQTCTYVVALVDPSSSDAVASAEGWLTETVNTLLDKGFSPYAGPVGRSGTSDVEPDLVRDRARYLAEIEQCQRLLRAGESYEICLTEVVVRPRPPDALAFYRRMRRHNPAPYGVFLRCGDVVVAGSSPELFLRIDADRQVSTRPIKGTAPRRDDPVEDRHEAEALGQSDKTRAENLMIVDLLRNDLGRVCEIGSITVPGFLAVETYATMHQLVSTVQGRLRSDVSALDCVRACFPGGSMTGAPKLRTMEIIDALEGQARGVYSGAVGYFGPDGSAELSIVIRTAVMWRQTMRVGAGGAIVLASDPAGEFAEMLLKASAPFGPMPLPPTVLPGT